MSDPVLVNADCLDAMGEIADGSVDLIACDLPYGTTQCKWDSIIPLAPLWAHYRRIIKASGGGNRPYRLPAFYVVAGDEQSEVVPIRRRLG